MNQPVMSAERRNLLFNLERRWQEWHEANPALHESRFLNHLHSQGISAGLVDLNEAHELSAVTPIASQGLSSGTAADFLGIKRTIFAHWRADGFPTDAPVLHCVGSGAKLYFDLIDLNAFKAWLDENGRSHYE